MKHHCLKALPEYFAAYICGDKYWSMRNNDRDFQEGDSVSFLEFDGTKETGHESPDFVIQRVWEFDWLPVGHVMLSLDPLPSDYVRLNQDSERKVV